MKNLLIIILVAAFLQGCSPSTPYEKYEKGIFLFSGGYSDTRLDDNVFQVTFVGNSETSKERIEDFILLRSAELALQNGYQYFVVVDEKNYPLSTITCFEEKPAGVLSYRARAVHEIITQKYGIEPK